MPLPPTGPITLAQIKAEFGGPDHKLSTYRRGAGYTTDNNTNVPASGTIGIGHFRGAAKVVPGSISLTTPGAHNFVVPAFTTLTVQLWGAGAGGDGGVAGHNSMQGYPGTAGGASTVADLGLSAGGGRLSGEAGIASGGTTNIHGGASSGVNPGAAPNSQGTPGFGGRGMTVWWDVNDSPRTTNCRGGGGGAFVSKSYSAGQLTPGGTLRMVVGAAGLGGLRGASDSTDGQRGEVRVSWS